MKLAGPGPASGEASRFERRGAERRLRARLVGLQAGRAITRHDAQGTWRTAIAKRAIASAIIGPEGITGDAVADRRHHGGTEQAILAYAAKHYAAWEAEWAAVVDGREPQPRRGRGVPRFLAAELSPADASPGAAPLPFPGAEGRAESGALADGGRRPAAAQNAPLRLPYGAFGENFTLDGVDETTVCIGDIWAAGALRLQVSQPREPCYKPGRYWGVPEAAARMIATRRTGWYLRVLASGQMQAAAHLMPRPTPPGEAASRAARAPTPAAPTDIAWRGGPQRGCAARPAYALAGEPAGCAGETTAAAKITPGAELVLEARPYPRWTVARALEVFYACKASGPTADAAALAACPALSPKWRARLTPGG
jgi:MOSC domain-containing protein YiiM